MLMLMGRTGNTIDYKKDTARLFAYDHISFMVVEDK